MKSFSLTLSVLSFAMLSCMSGCKVNTVQTQKPTLNDNYVIVIHGGAGTIKQRDMTSEQEKNYRATLQESLKAGLKVLEANGSAVDAVEAAVRVMEDSPLFNAGKGSVFTNDGKNEMDAAIMDGLNQKAGAVAGVRRIKNPISAAKAILNKGNFVLLSAEGAEQFAQENNIELVDTSYFWVKSRWEQLLRVRDSDKMELDHSSPNEKNKKKEHSDSKSSGQMDPPDALGAFDKFGTVGAVALDKYGNLAAATSTGGLVNKKYNRIGDSPLIGCGTYANNNSCAISCTGKGEDFIRLVLAHSVSCMMEIGGLPLEKAAQEMIMHRLPAMKGRGGLIGVDKAGHVTMIFNTAGMYRGYANGKGAMEVKIFKSK